MWPFDVLEGIFKDSLNFREIKPFEAQGEFREESLISVYASTLLTDTLPLRMRIGAPSEILLPESETTWATRILKSKGTSAQKVGDML